MTQYHDVTALLAWLDKFEKEGASGTLGLFTKSVADQVREKLGPEVQEAKVSPGVWEIPDIPRDRTQVWTFAADTGLPVRWNAVPMIAGKAMAYGRLWEPEAGGGRFTDLDVLGHGPVYDYNPDPGETQTERGLKAGQPQHR